jgi:membrane protease YdiL (CAAX protease family)
MLPAFEGNTLDLRRLRRKGVSMLDFLPACALGGGIAAALVFVLAIPALRGPNRWLVPVAMFAAFCDEFFLDLPDFRNDPLDFIGGHWNWTGKLFELVIALLFAAVLIGTRKFSRQDFGLTFSQRPGTARATVSVVVPYLAVMMAIVWMTSPHDVPDKESWAFQLTMPGFAEELYFRGVLLALFDRMYAGRKTVLGAPLGFGAIATTIAFAFTHGFGVDRSLAVDFSVMPMIFPFVGSFVAVWIRARSGSLVVPVAAHNASNVLAMIATMLV